jgi:hypothetical protein
MFAQHPKKTSTNEIIFCSCSWSIKEDFISLLHIVPFCEGPNEKPKGFAKQKQKT